MITLPASLKHWNSTSFKDTFKSEVLNLKPDSMPLHLATTQGGYVNYDNIGLSILSTNEDENYLNIKTGIFFTEVVGGCNCDDDPVETNNYCTLLINIDKSTSACSFTLIPD